MKRIYTILSAAALVMTAAAPAQAAGPLSFDGADATTVGIYIKDLSTGKVVASHNANLAMTPASVTKVITAASVLTKVGPDFRFETRVGLSGEREGGSRGTVWNGDIIINAAADPTLESDEFKPNRGFTDSIISHLRALGVKEINGTVVVLESLKDAGSIPQWEVEDVAWPYGAGLYGFNYAGNCVRVYPNKGITRPASNMTIKVRPAEGKSDDMIRGAYSNEMTFWLTPATSNKPDWSISASVDNPGAVYEALLLKRLNDAGIRISGRPSDHKRVAVQSVYNHYSPTAEVIMTNMMKRSDNLFAEGMLRTLDPAGDRDDCLKVQADLWAERGLNSRHTKINDGSGLTRSNKIPPAFLGDVLESMARSTLAEKYLKFFPVAGIDGTMKNFMKKTRLKGRLAMKTGSVSGVQCYAGYKVDGNNRPTHVVVVMVSGFFCPRAQVRAAISKYLLTKL